MSEVEARFWAKVRKSDNCWNWTAGRTSGGYGAFHDTSVRKMYRAHRFAYEILVGPIPPGMVLDHRCHNKLCVNPAHLRPVTVKQNGENRCGAPRHSSTGVLGVSYRKDRCVYTVRVGHNGVEVNGGQFTNLEEAAEAARKLRLSLFTHNDLDRKVA